MKRITSSSNETYAYVKKLVAQKSARQESGRFSVEGKRLFLDAIASGMKPELILISEAEGEQALFYEQFCENTHLLSAGLMKSACDTKTPQGVLAVFQAPPPCEDYSGDRSVLLCSLQDPGNLGTIIRTAEAFAIDRVILTSDCPEIYSPKVLRATMGGVFRVPITVAESAENAISAIKRAGALVVAAVAQGGEELSHGAMQGRVCVVIGNEGGGLPESVTALCDRSMRIPMRGRAQSLNAAMAAGIFLWEISCETRE